MVFVLDTAIAIGIWIPFTIGKSAALLSVRDFSLFDVLAKIWIYSARPPPFSANRTSPYSGYANHH